MPKIHLRQPGFIYSACEPLLKAKKEYKNYRNMRLTIYLSQ